MIGLVTETWTAVMTWLVTLFPEVTKFFVTGTGESLELTFAGVFAVVMAGVALILLVFNLIRSFLPMRG